LLAPRHNAVPGSCEQGLKVKGRLRAHIQFWKDIEASNFIIDTIQEGYKIPVRESPNPAIFSNNSSAFDNWQFVFDSITQLLITDRIVQMEGHDLIVCKQCLIPDLRYVNNHVYNQTIKFEDWRTALEYFESGSFFTKFDLKSGYHHLDIFSEHQPYLGFSWKMNGETPSYLCSLSCHLG
jgi:hypothetical protein